MIDLSEARSFVDLAVAQIPQLTVFGVGVDYSYWRKGKDVAAREIAERQATLYTDRSLRMIQCCAEWIRTRRPRKSINRQHSSYFFKHVVESFRRDRGEPDPYVYNGAFIAAAVGLGLCYEIITPNVLFNIVVSHVQ